MQIGQQVVCIYDFSLCLPNPEIRLPSVGCTYTIRGIRDKDNKSFLLLHEVRNPKLHYIEYPEKVEIAFMADGFRIVEKRKTDISVFNKMLVPNKHLENV